MMLLIKYITEHWQNTQPGVLGPLPRNGTLDNISKWSLSDIKWVEKIIRKKRVSHRLQRKYVHIKKFLP